MKAQEIKKMVGCKAVESVRVMQLFDGDKEDWMHGGWVIEFHMTWKMFSNVELETARGEIRKFKTLDAVNKFLTGLKIWEYQVTNPRNKEPEG